MITNRQRTEGGAALITALVVAALATVAAVAMASRTQLEIGRVRVQVESARRESLVESVEARVRATLHTDAQSGRHDSADDDWANVVHTVSLGDSEASAVVRDEQRLFNLNNLVVTARNLGGGTRRRNRGTEPVAGSLPTAEAPAMGEARAGRQASPGRSRTNARAAGNSSPTAAGSATGAAPAVDTVAAAQAPAQQFEERTRFVLDRSVARSISGRGRPSDVAAIVGSSALPRVAETYLEAIPADVSGETASVEAISDPGSASAFPDTGVNTVPGQTNFAAPGNVPVSANPGATPNAGMNTGADPVPSAAASAIPGQSPGGTLPPNELWIARFSLLLKRLEIRDPILQPILDWLDSDSEVRFPNGAEDAYYSKLEIPYRAANRPFADISELLLVRGVTPEVYERLVPFVTALPVHTEVNVNTAPSEILMSLAPTIDRRIAELIVSAREVQPFRSTAAMLALPMLAAAGIDDYGMSVGSEYFEVTTTVTTGESIEQSRAIVGRVRDGRSRIVSRRNGYFDE